MRVREIVRVTQKDASDSLTGSEGVSAGRLAFWRGIIECGAYLLIGVAVVVGVMALVSLAGCASSQVARRPQAAPAVNVGPLAGNLSDAQVANLSAADRARRMRLLLAQDAKLIREIP